MPALTCAEVQQYMFFWLTQSKGILNKNDQIDIFVTYLQTLHVSLHSVDNVDFKLTDLKNQHDEF